MGPVGYPCASALALPAVIRHSMSMNRRRFLQLSTSAAGLFALRPLFAADDAGAPISKGASFLLASDTHYIANKEQPDAMDETSREINARLVEWLNKLPGTDIPAEAGGGEEDGVHGVIHSGDLIDSGDKTDAAHEAMQKTEWSAFASDWGLNGGDGKLRLPVREVWGNHDGPQGKGLVIDQLRERNTRRKDVNVSANGMHFSWDWSGVHFRQGQIGRSSQGLPFRQDGLAVRSKRRSGHDRATSNSLSEFLGALTVVNHGIDRAFGPPNHVHERWTAELEVGRTPERLGRIGAVRGKGQKEGQDQARQQQGPIRWFPERHAGHPRRWKRFVNGTPRESEQRSAAKPPSITADKDDIFRA